MPVLRKIVLILLCLAGLLPKVSISAPYDSLGGNCRLIVKQIVFKGNTITKDAILFRELQFGKGDTLTATELSEQLRIGQENLMNTSLFNFVEILPEYSPLPTPQAGNSCFEQVKLTIKLTERWYTWPFPVFMIKERNFNTWLKDRSMNNVTYGFFLQQNNFRGRKERMMLTLLYGYDQKAGLTYEKPYINKRQTIGIMCSAFYTRNHSAPYGSYNNKQQSVSFKDDFVMDFITLNTRLTYRRDFHIYHSLSVNYTRLNFSDTLLKLNPDYIYGNMRHPDFFGFTYRLKVDFRDYQPYPLKGWYFDMELTKTGLSLMGDQVSDMFNSKTSLRYFAELSPRWHFATGLSTKYSFRQYVPYYFQKGLGYDNDYVRGYEYYVVDGQDYALIKNALKFTLVPKAETTVPFIKTEKFSRIHYTLHMNLFADFARVSDRFLYNANYLSNRWISGYGVGFDFVTYYDKVFRLEFSRNDKGESGFFVNFVSPI